MKARQAKEMLGVEEAHMLEYQQFNTHWDQKCKDYDEQCESQVNAMKERHLEELREFQRKLLERQPRPKFSPILLNYRQIEEHLARAKNYGEAHKVKAKADRMEARETEQWNALKQREMFQQESQFKAAKRQELSALQKRVRAGREEQAQRRRLALERLTQRYTNVKNELRTAQKLDRIHVRRQSSGLKGGGR